MDNQTGNNPGGGSFNGNEYNGNNYNNGGGNPNNGGNSGNGGNNGGRKNNHNGQVILSFIMVTLVALFVVSLLVSRFTQMSWGDYILRISGAA